MSTYTDNETKKLIEIYTANPILETVDRLCVILNRPKKSIIQKLVKEGVYEKRGYRDKQGQKPITKLAIVRELESLLGTNLTGLDKAPKLTLKTLHTKVSELHDLTLDAQNYKELAELRGEMLDKR